MRAILKGLLSLACSCLGINARANTPAETGESPVLLLTGPKPAQEVDAYGRSKVTRLNVGSGVPLDTQQMRENYQSDSARIVAALSAAEQAEVCRYLLACHQVGNLFKSVRLYGKLFKQEELSDRFYRAERAYSALGLLPILPTTVTHGASHSLSEAVALGLIQRRVPAAPITFFASGIGRHVDMLDRRYQAQQQHKFDKGVR